MEVIGEETIFGIFPWSLVYLINIQTNKNRNTFVNNLFGIFMLILHFKSVVGIEYIDITTDSTLVGSL